MQLAQPQDKTIQPTSLATTTIGKYFRPGEAFPYLATFLFSFFSSYSFVSSALAIETHHLMSLGKANPASD